MLTFSDDEVRQLIQQEVGIRPSFALEAFSDLEGGVHQSIAGKRQPAHTKEAHRETPCVALSTTSKQAGSTR